MGLIRRLLGLGPPRPPADAGAVRRISAQGGGGGGELQQILDGELDPRGRGATPGGSGGVTPPAGDGRSAVGVLCGQVKGEPVRPRAEYYADVGAFDAAFLAYQDARMRQLLRRFPDAAYAGQLFHGTDLPPEVVLVTGLPQKGAGDNFDIREHQLDFHQLGDPPETYSALRGACIDATTPGLFAGEGGYVYALVPRGGAVDLLAALGGEQAKGASGEHEVCFGARQPACQIVAWYKVGAYSDVHGAHRLEGPFPNPNFSPIS
jgi:hypothetical protein